MATYKDEEIKGWKISQSANGTWYVSHISNPIKSRKSTNTKDKKKAIKIAKLHKMSFDYKDPNTPIFKKAPSEKVEQQRIERLTTQPPGYPGTAQAVVDSAKMYKDLGPQYKPGHIKKTEKLKTVRTEIKKLTGEIEKLKDEVDAYKSLTDTEVKMLMPEKKISLEAKVRRLEIKKNNLRRIKKKYPDYNIDDPINILD